ncbi:MAG TPA: G1 family glutamic endopeptidase [Candidatus Limnocylindria bacterium]|nr:G1 family glutamic endopeptidase [Candidatus Limnocylindria bacterium]
MRRVLIVVAILLTACGGQIDLGRLVDQLQPDATAAAVATEASTAAVRDVIERANEAQVKAFLTGDASFMRDTATDSHYELLAEINRDLARGGVVSFSLVGIEWGSVTVSGATAAATAYETWRTTYSDGSQDQRTDRNDYTLVLDGGTWKIDSNVQPSAQSVAPAAGPTQTQPDTTTPARISDTSSNWSGYVATGGTYTSVSGTWIVPTVSATSAGADATWVGIGGVTGTDLIQAGTQATVTGSGAVTYSAWTEILPDYSRPAPLEVTAGDSVTVTITEQTRGVWLIVMVNNTTRDSYEKTLRYDSSRSSAEWIQEAPSTDRGIIPLSAFGTVRFLAGNAVRDGVSLGLSQLDAQPVAMINRAGQLLAVPSTLGSDGSSFAVTRTDAPGTVQGGGRTRRRG